MLLGVAVGDARRRIQFMGLLPGVGELDSSAIIDHPGIAVGVAVVAIPDTFAVVACLLVCKLGVLDAVLDSFGVSVSENEVASTVRGFHEAVVDISAFCPARLDRAGVVSADFVGVVGVTPHEVSGWGFECFWTREDILESVVRLKAQFAACSLDALWGAIDGVCAGVGLGDYPVGVFCSEASLIGAECDREDLLPLRVIGACPVDVIVIFHASEQTTAPVVSNPLVLVIASNQHISVV